MLPVEPGQLHERDANSYLVYAQALWGGGIELHYARPDGYTLQRIYRDDGAQFYDRMYSNKRILSKTGLMFYVGQMEVACNLSSQNFQAIHRLLDPQRKLISRGKQLKEPLEDQQSATRRGKSQTAQSTS